MDPVSTRPYTHSVVSTTNKLSGIIHFAFVTVWPKTTKSSPTSRRVSSPPIELGVNLKYGRLDFFDVRYPLVPIISVSFSVYFIISDYFLPYG